MSRKGKGIFYLIVGPSAVGKTTLFDLIQERYQHPEYQSLIDFSVTSYTTREPRQDDFKLNKYCYVTKEAFQEMVQRNEFLETALVHGNWYGTLKAGILNSINNNVDMIKVIDWQGAEKMKSLLGDRVRTVFVSPTSMDELALRLAERGGDSTQMRIDGAIIEMKYASKCDYVIVNKHIEQMVNDFDAIMIANRLAMPRAWHSLDDDVFKMHVKCMMYGTPNEQ